MKSQYYITLAVGLILILVPVVVGMAVNGVVVDW
jgi:hypothetical protein